MEFYRIEAKKTSHGLTLRSPAFGITVDAGEDELDKALQAMRGLMADEAQRMLDAGRFLPKDDKLEDNGSVAFYMETDFGGRFLARTSETVRRNISMPAWMDLRLRHNNVDASRLFQDAASAKLKELEQAGTGARRITDIRDLEDMCPKEVLDIWLKKQLEKMMEKRQED